MANTQLPGDIMMGASATTMIPFLLATADQLKQAGAARAWQVDYLEDSTRKLTGVDRNSSQTKDTVEFVYRWERVDGGYGDGEDVRPNRYSWGYADGSSPLRTTCPPKINTVTLTNATTNLTSILEVLGLIYCCSGRYLLSVNPASSDALASVKDFGASEVCQDMAIFEDYLYVAMTTSNMLRYGPLSNSPSWSSAHASLKFLWFHMANETLWGVSPYVAGTGGNPATAGKLKKCVAGASGSAWTAGNWTAGDPVGFTETELNKPLHLGKDIFVGKAEGFFSYDASAEIQELIPDLSGYQQVLNFHHGSPFRGRLYLPHETGLFTYHPGSGRIVPVGPESHELNTSAVKGYVRECIPVGRFLYLALEDTSGHTYILKGLPTAISEKEPFAWWPLTKITSNVTRSMYYSDLSEPRLWFGNDTNVSYYRLGSTLTYEDGQLTWPYYDDGFPFDDKIFESCAVEGTFPSGTSIVVYYTLDGGTERTGGTFTSETAATISANNVGKRISVRVSLVAKTDNSATPVLRSVTFTGVRRPSSRAIITAQILCADAQVLRNGQKHPLRAADQLSQLRTWSTNTSAITVVAPEGTSRSMVVLNDLKETEVGILSDRHPEIVATVKLRA